MVKQKRIAASCVDSFFKAIRKWKDIFFNGLSPNARQLWYIQDPKIRTIGHRKLAPTGFNSNVLTSDNPRRPSSAFYLSVPLSTCPSFTKQEMRKRSTWKLKISRNSKKVFAGSRRSNEKCVIAATASWRRKPVQQFKKHGNAKTDFSRWKTMSCRLQAHNNLAKHDRKE